MRLASLFILFIFVLSLSLKADNSFKYSIEPSDYYEGGMLLPDSSNGISMYFLKPSAIDTSDFIYKWKGFKRNKSEGFSYGTGTILTACIRKNQIYTVAQKPGQLILRVFSQDFEPISQTLIDSTVRIGEAPDCSINVDAGYAFVLCFNTLYKIKLNSNEPPRKISDNVQFFNLVNSISNYNVNNYFYVEKNASASIIKFLNRDDETDYSTKIDIAENMNFIVHGNFLGIFSSNGGSRNSLSRIIDITNGAVKCSGWIAANPLLIDFNIENEHFEFSSVIFSEDKYIYRKYKNENTNIIEDAAVDLPYALTEPISLKILGESNYLIFRNGFVIVDNSYNLIAYDPYPIGERFNKISQIYLFDHHLVLSSKNASAIFRIDEHPYWFITRFFRNAFRNIFFIVLIVLLALFVQLYRHQRRLFNEVLELQTIGIIFILDSTGKLKIANHNGMEFLNINESVPLGKLFGWYAQTEGTIVISEIIEKTSRYGDNFSGPVTLKIDRNDKEFFVRTIILRNIAGINRGIVCTAVDITEQIERKRLSNWAQLAHDMQTNLSTIRLNAEQLDTETSENNKSRRKKIVHQVNLLMHRVRDLVTVGRSDSVNLSPVNSVDICNDARNEFDDSVFPNISFHLNINDFELNADKPKLIRAIRNAIENGIKAMPEQNGDITLSAFKNGKQAVFKIKDSGIGMDEETKTKMLTPYFTTARDRGGSGIGTMIMQHVIEMHGGELLVESQKGIGTEITFILPLNKKSDRN